jgi:hypothetical protein
MSLVEEISNMAKRYFFQFILILSAAVAFAADLEIPSGNEANLSPTVPNARPRWTNDTNRLFIGTGTGRVEITGQGAAAVATHEATHAHGNLPTTSQKGALAGTDGAPSGTNKYVTNQDPRNSNSRTPTSHGSSHAGAGSDAIPVATISNSGLMSAPDKTKLDTLSAGSKHTIQDEGGALTNRANLNFKGAGVTAADNAAADATDITISLSQAPVFGTYSSGVLTACTNGGKFIFDKDGDYAAGDCEAAIDMTATAEAGGGMVYPGAGVPLSTGTAWGTSYTVGTGASNLVQLNGSSQLPAVSAALLTSFPTLNQSTTGTAAGLTAAYIDWSLSSGGGSILNKPSLAATTTCTGTQKVSAYNATTGAFTCSADQEGTPGGGITSLGTLTAATQTFANDTNVTITSATSTHTLGWTGTLAKSRGGAGADMTNVTFPTTGTIATTASNISGTAANLSGTPALPNGTTATTQTQADNSTKLATTAYVDTGLAAKAPSAGSSSITTVGTVTSGNVTAVVTAASTLAAGKVQLSDSTSTTSSVLAATPTAVKAAYDLAATKQGTLTNSAGLASALSDETGTGSAVFGTNPTINGGIYSQTTASANTITIDTSAYSGATLTATGATTVTITNVVAGKYFDFKIYSSGGGAITIATLTPTWVTGTPTSITATKSSWFVCKGTGTNTADCAAVKENF